MWTIKAIREWMAAGVSGRCHGPNPTPGWAWGIGRCQRQLWLNDSLMLSGPILGQFSSYVGPILGQKWVFIWPLAKGLDEHASLGHVEAMLGTCWPHVEPLQVWVGSC